MSELYCLVEQEIPRLRRYARALTRASDRADDLVQDTLLRALTKLHLWQPGTELRECRANPRCASRHGALAFVAGSRKAPRTDGQR
jgi:hypothetical protein